MPADAQRSHCSDEANRLIALPSKSCAATELSDDIQGKFGGPNRWPNDIRCPFNALSP
jgi:hypothetical protein